MKDLNLNGCKIEASAFFYFGDALEENEVLAHLRMSTNFGSWGVRSLVPILKDKNQTLKSLDLYGNDVGSATIRDLMDISATRNIQINLNRVGDWYSDS